MFEDLQYLLRNEEIAPITKVTLMVIIKGLSWFPWVFVGIGLLLNHEYFVYWLAFFMFIEGFLFLALIYVLILILKSTIQNDNHNLPKQVTEDKKKGLANILLDGIIGNIGWEVFLVVVFIILKASGLIDNTFNTILKSVN